MVSIVEAQVAVGKLNEALEASNRIGDARYRSSALFTMTRVLAKAGRMGEALETARRIENEDFRSEAMVVVAEVMTKNRETDKARCALAEAKLAAQQISKNSEKSTRLAAVAKGLAKLHDYRLASETADLCAASGERLAAYTAIFREYITRRNPQLKALFEKVEWR